MSTSFLENLTPPQLEAVTHMEGPMLVVAGAGSGKTRVVTCRIAHLISQGVHPNQIVAMTFTNKAAGEMKERVNGITGHTPRWVGTFHSICARFLRYDLDKLNEGRTGSFSIYDSADQQGLVKQITKDLNFDDKRFQPRGILSKISRAKCDLIEPGDYGAGSWDDESIGKIYAEYENRLRMMNALDFDDLLILTIRMLSKMPELTAHYRSRYPFILIDEYQDTNRAQYKLMRLLTGDRHNVHATGDPDQSIYSWRGAEYQNIMDFQKDFPEARVVRLEQNYRSTKTIIAAANELIHNNQNRIHKDLFTENDEGEKIAVANLPDDRTEAKWAAEKVSEMRSMGQSLHEMAVFYRTNAQSRPFEEALMREAIPYQIVGGIRFYERKEIKDILAHLKILVNPRDMVSFKRITECRPTGVGAKTLESITQQCIQRGEGIFDFMSREDFASVYQGRTSKKLKEFAGWCHNLMQTPHAPLSECVKTVIEASGLIEHIESRSDRDEASEDRIDNLKAFFNRAVEFDVGRENADLPTFLEDVALVADIDTWDEEGEKLSLMTLHSAKGLEFPYVFLVGLEEGLLPHQNSWEPAAEEEERRLFYVGLTRAKKQAFITHADCRMQWGKTNFSAPSRFLEELPEELLEHEGAQDPFFGGGSIFGEDAPKKKRSRGKSDDDFFDDFADDFFDYEDESQEFADEVFPPSPRGGSLRSGDLVMHTTFGKGKVLAVSGKEVVVQFFATGTKKLHPEAANLRKC